MSALRYCLTCWRMDIPHFIHSFAHGHLGCSQPLALVNSAAMNIHSHTSFHVGIPSLSVLLGVHLEAGFLCQMVIPCLPFRGAARLLVQSGCTIFYFYQQCAGVQCPHILTRACRYLTFSFLYSNLSGCRVVFSLWFLFAFP